MKRSVLLGVLLLALGVIGVTSVWLLDEDPPVVAPPSVDAAPAEVPEPPPEVVIPAAPVEEPPAEPMPEEEPPLPPGAWPWSLPEWWDTVDAGLQAGRIRFGRETLPIADILARIADAAEVAVTLGPELSGWAEGRTVPQSPFTGSTRDALDRFAERLNLAVVPGPDGVKLHRRDAVPDGRVPQAALARWEIETARARAAGERKEHPSSDDLRSGPIAIGLERVSFRRAMAALEEHLGTPVRCGRQPWEANPSIDLPPADRTLGALLDAVAERLGGRVEVSPRGIVFLGPEVAR